MSWEFGLASFALLLGRASVDTAVVLAFGVAVDVFLDALAPVVLIEVFQAAVDDVDILVAHQTATPFAGFFNHHFGVILIFIAVWTRVVALHHASTLTAIHQYR